VAASEMTAGSGAPSLLQFSGNALIFRRFNLMKPCFDRIVIFL
jgi:hypothetical protein